MFDDFGDLWVLLVPLLILLAVAKAILTIAGGLVAAGFLVALLCAPFWLLIKVLRLFRDTSAEERRFRYRRWFGESGAVTAAFIWVGILVNAACWIPDGLSLWEGQRWLLSSLLWATSIGLGVWLVFGSISLLLKKGE